MVAKGMKDAHRDSYSGGVKAVEREKWGRAKAEERYGPLQFRDGAPPPSDQPQKPQARENQHGPNYDNDSPNTWVRGFGKNFESAEGKVNFDSRGKDGRPKKW